ncbi:MAG: hypothetical protein WKF85_14065 [Chitinophagaceae bacterium]
MDEPFDIPVTYKGEELLFKGELLAYTYSYKIQVEVDGNLVLFEPDDERNLRAMINPENFNEGKKIDVELLKCIGKSLEEILK